MKYLIINKIFNLDKNISNEDDIHEAAIDIGLLSGDYTILETLDNFREACKHLDQYKSKYYRYGLCGKFDAYYLIEYDDEDLTDYYFADLEED